MNDASPPDQSLGGVGTVAPAPGRHSLALKPLTLVTLAWAVLCLGTLAALMIYKQAPGAMQFACHEQDSGLPDREDLAPYRLVMAVHPKCPCSTASVRQLERLLARTGSQMSVTMLAYRPSRAPADWERTPLAARAQSVANAQLIVDDNGQIAARLGLCTSGATVLYGPDGVPLFSGGITPSRGHEGDCTGADAVLAAVQGRRVPVSTAPVYGCSLDMNPSAEL
ncbi:MAG: hypothetical protein KF688_07360 [Pirellulales bacterium]|nr:hypothetical protein [Pirellulales bacterium]